MCVNVWVGQEMHHRGECTPMSLHVPSVATGPELRLGQGGVYAEAAG